MSRLPSGSPSPPPAGFVSTRRYAIGDVVFETWEIETRGVTLVVSYRGARVVQNHARESGFSISRRYLPLMPEDGVPFEIVLAHLDGYARVTIRGELDYMAVESHAEALQELTDLRRNVLIDLTEVTFIDSGGLSALVRIAQHHEGPVRLEGVAPNIRRILTLTGLEPTFDITDERRTSS